MIFNRKELVVLFVVAGSGIAGWGIQLWEKHSLSAAGGFTVAADTVALPAQAKVSPEAVPRTPPPPKAHGPVCINTALKTELETLNGVGPALAERIIAYRTANGGFKSIEDLRKVKGIGPKKFEKIKADVVLNTGAPAQREPVQQVQVK